MNQQQQKRVWEVLGYLAKARHHLDVACHRCGEISDEEYTKLRSAYSAVCDAIDKL